MEQNRNLSVITWIRLVRVVQRISHAGTEQIERHGLSGAQFDVLAQIAAKEGQLQQDIAQELLVTKGNISQLLAKLERDKFIERRQEGRANHLFLTEKGRALVAQILPKHDAFITEHMQKLSPDELRQLLALLRKLDKKQESGLMS